MCLGSLLIVILCGSQVTLASSDSVTFELTLHHEVMTEQGGQEPAQHGGRFSVYQLTPELSSQAAAQEIQTSQLATEDFIQKMALEPFCYGETDAFGKLTAFLPVFIPKTQNYAHYLIVQDDSNIHSNNDLVVEERSLPILLQLPLDETLSETSHSAVTLYTKAASYQRVPYFFKIGRKEKVDRPLEGAEFVFYFLEKDGAKHYLSANKEQTEWHPSDTPLTDPMVRKIYSDERGLVMLEDVTLTHGRYYFDEIKAPTGYELSEDSVLVPVDIPVMTSNDVSEPIQVNGTPLEKLEAGQLPQAIIDRAKPEVLNMANTPPFNKEKEPPKKETLKLPQTNEHSKNYLRVVGLSLVGLTMIVIKKRRETYEKED